MKKLIMLVLVFMVFGLTTGCLAPDDADVVSYNLSKEADMFNVNRRVVFYNGITGDYILVVEGKCSIEVDNYDNQLELTVKTGENSYKKHFLGLSDNVTYFAEQVDSYSSNPYRYKVIFKPMSIIPDVDIAK